MKLTILTHPVFGAGSVSSLMLLQSFPVVDLFFPASNKNGRKNAPMKLATVTLKLVRRNLMGTHSQTPLSPVAAKDATMLTKLISAIFFVRRR